MGCIEAFLTLIVFCLLGGMGLGWVMETTGDAVGFMALYFIITSVYIIWRFTRPVHRFLVKEIDGQFVYMVLFSNGRIQGTCSSWLEMYMWLEMNYPQYLTAFVARYPRRMS